MKALYHNINLQVEKDFMAFTALAIILSTCLGSIAVMYALMGGHGFIEMAQVFLVVLVCGAHNASILTVQKPRVVLNLLILSVIVSTMITLLNMLF